MTTLYSVANAIRGTVNYILGIFHDEHDLYLCRDISV